MPVHQRLAAQRLRRPDQRVRLQHPVFGLPHLPFITAPVGEAHGYNPVPASDVMPVQESGTKSARPLPYQPNANLTGFTTAGGTTTAELALSNSAPFADRSAHFSVYDNTLTTTPSVAAYPVGFPGQYTVAPSTKKIETVAATGPVGSTGAYDITVIGANRFLRRFTGDLAFAARRSRWTPSTTTRASSRSSCSTW